MGQVDGVEDGADLERVAEFEEGFVDGAEDDAQAFVEGIGREGMGAFSIFDF